MAELTQSLKSKGDKASYATSTNPSTILSEAYNVHAGLSAVQVNYKSSADFMNDMASGRIDYVWTDPVVGLAGIRNGTFQPLAVSTGKRISSLADIPTMREAGLPGIDMNLSWITAAPAGTPQPVVDKLHDWFTKIGEDPETKSFLAQNGAEPWTATLPEAKEVIEKKINDWAEYVRLAKIAPN